MSNKVNKGKNMDVQFTAKHLLVILLCIALILYCTTSYHIDIYLEENLCINEEENEEENEETDKENISSYKINKSKLLLMILKIIIWIGITLIQFYVFF